MNEKLEKITNYTAEDLKRIRLECNISQGDLANLLGICQGSLSAYERGQKPIGRKARKALHELTNKL